MLWSLPAAFGNTYYTLELLFKNHVYAKLFVPDYDHGRKGPL